MHAIRFAEPEFRVSGFCDDRVDDGKDYDGGAEITSLILKRDRVSIKLDRDLDVEMSFRLHDRKFAKLKSFLKRMIHDRVYMAE